MISSILDEIASYDHFLSQATSKLVFAEAAPELTSKQFETLKKYRADLAKKYKPTLEGYALMTEQELEIKELREKIAVLESKSLNQHLEWKPYDLVMDTYAQMLNETTWTYEKTESNLKEAWGNDFVTNANAAQRAFTEFAPSDVNPHDPVWNHPGVMKLLARMGAEIGEDSVAAKPAGRASASMTKDEGCHSPKCSTKSGAL